MIVIRVRDYKAPNIWGVCWKQPVQRPCCPLRSGNCDNYFVAWWSRDLFHTLKICGGQKFIHHGQMWQILLFFPCPWIMKRKNPPLRLPYDWGRIGLQPFLCANARFKSKRWILMAMFRQSPNGHTQIFHQQEVQGAVQSINCNSLTRVWATPL